MQSDPGAVGGAPARPSIQAATAVVQPLFQNLSAVVRGKPEAIRLALVALLSGGHLLVEDVPGVGKTLLAKAMAKSLGGTFRRIQATPDLLPSDLTGVSVFHRGTESWEFRHGPLFANVVLVDEINRATPRTQSALLEAMEERQITIDGETRQLPEPFFVVATQNPFEHSGTFPLVEGQRDRFAIVVQMGLPGRRAERELLLGVGGSDSLGSLVPVVEPDLVRAAIDEVRHVHCEGIVADYVLDVVDATRSHADIVLGASPRASLSVLHAAQAYAVTAGRAYVTPDDVKAVVPAALAHRVILAGGPDLRTATATLNSILASVPAPVG